MTPDQLKQYVDNVIHSRDMLTCIIFVAIPIISIGGSLLVAYMNEKGKNLATKEDIGQITDKVEAVKLQYSGELEKLRSELASKTHFNKVRYERELKVFQEVWPKLSALTKAALALRPVIDTAPGSEETEESRKRSRTEMFAKAFDELLLSVHCNRPFYPESVWTEIRRLLEICWSEAVDYRFIHQKQLDSFDKAQENAKKIEAQNGVICEAIRERLAKFD